MANKLELIIPPPLKQMFQSCAVFCEPACCGLDAFDVDAFVIYRWFCRDAHCIGDDVLKQLDDLIARVASHDGPIDSADELKFDFGHEWATSAECVAYLQTWRVELVRAISFDADVLERPDTRLLEARSLGENEFRRTVRRIVGDADIFLSKGKTGVAMKILGPIAALDENDAAIRQEVKYAREILAKHTGNPGLVDS